MADVNNPYQSPAAGTVPVKPLMPQGALTETMLKSLADTSPWLRFLGIMGFVSSGLYVLTGVLFFILLPFAENLAYYFAGLGMDFYGLIVVVYALVFIAAGVILLFPALYTYGFGAKIRAYLQTNSDQELEQAFRQNKNLWRFNGILMIIGLAAMPVFIIIITIVAATMI